MGIFDLRTIARELGHNNATTQKKENLINFVLNKRVKIAFEKKKMGRPPLKVVSRSKIIYDEDSITICLHIKISVD